MPAIQIIGGYVLIDACFYKFYLPKKEYDRFDVPQDSVREDKHLPPKRFPLSVRSICLPS
jgi:hypothetical protein